MAVGIPFSARSFTDTKTEKVVSKDSLGSFREFSDKDQGGPNDLRHFSKYLIVFGSIKPSGSGVYLRQREIGMDGSFVGVDIAKAGCCMMSVFIQAIGIPKFVGYR